MEDKYQFKQNKTGKPIYRICVTGGPCAGKTTSLITLKERLTERGFKVFTVPEIPTITMLGGGMIIMKGLTNEKACRFQTLLMKEVMNLEDYFYELAVLNDEPAVILMDRGVMDARAYMDENRWQTILDETGWNPVYLRDKRYDAVIHLITAADGAEAFYTLENNAARYEDVPTAIKVDQALQNAWRGHPHQVIIDNNVPGFDKKIEKTVQSVERYIGIPVTSSYYRKFLVQEYTEKNQFEKLRKRGQNGAFSYVHTIRQKTDNKDLRCEVKSSITAREYINLYERRNNAYQPIKKERITFLYDKISYILEKFDGIILLRYVSDIEVSYNFVQCTKLSKEVTEDESFSTFHQAQQK
ncbi:hypothetical protein IMG5_152760 [Ichthyophthirius multifiliis]|uniref:NadR/Ttd14 AAA domain-containing protein n=1 Tax=Ichthyophthirius multifiliis TaxID=5932 RepID=G0QYW3_ICHMU|nr:hypothetical protein IMG5_152760 [Ichthyophthirius multifiliis]EGR29592.1 hypothetical protein IMG5_152760 [Ichthyophthirius multifiliis]|eukprot:XP_004030828.1 hypothetical protein IMG5_152760 [Ichthyophthirius multifiliis]